MSIVTDADRAEPSAMASGAPVRDRPAPLHVPQAPRDLRGLVPRQRRDPLHQRLTRGSTYRRRLLRYGVVPYLLMLDCASLVIPGMRLDGGLLLTGTFVAAAVSSLALSGLYRSRLALSVLDDLPRLVAAVVAGGIAVFALHALLDDVPNARRTLAALALAALALVAARFGAFSVLRWARRRGVVRHRAVVLGAGQVGVRIARVLQEHPEFGLVPLGFLDSRPLVQVAELPAPLLGDWQDIDRVIGERRVSQVIVAFSQLKEVELVDVLRTCDRLHCEIFYVPRLFELHNVTRDVDDVRGVPLVRIRRPAFRALSWPVKRVVDVVVSGVALLILSPVLAACALAVRWDTGPGVLFRQERVGLDGRPFQILKFRSLRPVDERESQTQWNVQHDQRLGRIGRLLRSTSLDELPQLWNVLVGHMSLVGPRPERPYFVDQYSRRVPRYTARHRVPAGLTGWAQINGLRGDTSIEDRARFDNHYIENWSLWGDLKIMLRTVQQVVGRQGG